MGLDVLYLLIPVTLVLAGIALGLFVWAIHTGQFDDLETPAIRILFDDAPPPAEAHGPTPNDGAWVEHGPPGNAHHGAKRNE